jgi:hypothetical protein
MDREAEGNYNKFARMLNVDVSQLHKIINSNSNAGPKFLEKLINYCQKNNLDFIEYLTSHDGECLYKKIVL